MSANTFEINPDHSKDQVVQKASQMYDYLVNKRQRELCDEALAILGKLGITRTQVKAMIARLQEEK